MLTHRDESMIFIWTIFMYLLGVSCGLLSGYLLWGVA